jgi:hypothetical protein
MLEAVPGSRGRALHQSPATAWRTVLGRNLAEKERRSPTLDVRPTVASAPSVGSASTIPSSPQIDDDGNRSSSSIELGSAATIVGSAIAAQAPVLLLPPIAVRKTHRRFRSASHDVAAVDLTTEYTM